MDLFDKYLRRTREIKYVDITEYPIVSKEQLGDMKEKAMGEEDYVVFGFVRVHNGNPFVDIYIHKEEILCRFAISKGKYLKEADEWMYQYWFWVKDNDLVVNPDNFLTMIRDLGDYLPELVVRNYDNPKDVFMHLYYAGIPGVKEILYKSGLNHIAHEIDDFESYNYVGGTPEHICDIPLGMLRKLNTREMTDILKSSKNREISATMYKRYHSVINGVIEDMSISQWKYLEELIREDGVINSHLYQYLTDKKDDDFFLYYKMYCFYREIIDESKKFPIYPENFEKKYEEVRLLLGILENEIFLNRKLEEKKRLLKSYYTYESDKYKLDFPQNMEEFSIQALKQQNCVLSYAIEAAETCGRMILFLWEQSAQQVAAVVEIDYQEKCICQAYRKFNRPLECEEKEFMREYCELKKIYWKELC